MGAGKPVFTPLQNEIQCFRGYTGISLSVCPCVRVLVCPTKFSKGFFPRAVESWDCVDSAYLFFIVYRPHAHNKTITVHY